MFEDESIWLKDRKKVCRFSEASQTKGTCVAASSARDLFCALGVWFGDIGRVKITRC